MSTKHLGSQSRAPDPSRPPTRFVDSERARWLLRHHYTAIYGVWILKETPRSLRPKIEALRASLRELDRKTYGGQMVYTQTVRAILGYERVSELLELFPQF